ncbi:hypothetical protein QBC39DRAFT_376988 [Podospora conica]|nr:hypothetical protein QBC39DRAFT_376988 [Schizothecium conicum]
MNTVRPNSLDQATFRISPSISDGDDTYIGGHESHLSQHLLHAPRAARQGHTHGKITSSAPRLASRAPCSRPGSGGPVFAQEQEDQSEDDDIHLPPTCRRRGSPPPFETNASLRDSHLSKTAPHPPTNSDAILSLLARHALSPSTNDPPPPPLTPSSSKPSPSLPFGKSTALPAY